MGWEHTRHQLLTALGRAGACHNGRSRIGMWGFGEFMGKYLVVSA